MILQFGADASALVDQYRQWAVSALVFVGTLLIAYLVARFVVTPPVGRVLAARNRNNPTLVSALEQYLKVLVVVVATPVAMAAAGFGGIVAGSAVVVAAITLAVGVAGQDVIGNLVGGLFLVADPDFNVGDYIEWDDRAGTIAEIDLRVTRVRTLADEVIVVPNTVLTTTAVRAPYSGNRYRVTETLSIAYEEDTSTVAEILTAAAGEDDRILDSPEPSVEVTDLGDSAIELDVHFWVADPKNTDIAEVHTDFNSRAKDQLLDAGVTIAPAAARALTGTVDVRLDSD